MENNANLPITFFLFWRLVILYENVSFVVPCNEFIIVDIKGINKYF